MAKDKAISNERIIAALMTHGTIKEAAKAAGVSTRTIYDRKNKDPEFLLMYNEAKADIARTAAAAINAKTTEAIDAVADIMTDRSVNPATRLQAAQTILNNAGKFTDRLTESDAISYDIANPNPLDELL